MLVSWKHFSSDRLFHFSLLCSKKPRYPYCSYPLLDLFLLVSMSCIHHCSVSKMGSFNKCVYTWLDLVTLPLFIYAVKVFRTCVQSMSELLWRLSGAGHRRFYAICKKRWWGGGGGGGINLTPAICRIICQCLLINFPFISPWGWRFGIHIGLISNIEFSILFSM